MHLTSSVFLNGQPIPRQYTCQGENSNPPLTITDVPQGTASFAISVTDPDSPSGNFVHWLIWNIPSESTTIAENTIPAGAEQGLNDFNKLGYKGPCPAEGEHHYHFTLYALNRALTLAEGATFVDFQNDLAGNLIEQTDLIGTYAQT